MKPTQPNLLRGKIWPKQNQEGDILLFEFYLGKSQTRYCSQDHEGCNTWKPYNKSRALGGNY